MFGKSVDADAEDELGDFFLSLTIPDALNPDGWFARLPKTQQEGLRGCSRSWHLNHWSALKAIAQKPTL